VERGLYIAASGMLADQLRQDVIANNLANATTAGFKGDRSVGEAFPSMLLSELGSGRQIGALGTGTRIAGVDVNDAQGALRNTGNKLDLAISGDGFFAVRAPGGVRYTRDGAFTTDAGGRIVTADGSAVLDTAGRPITLPRGSGEPTIDQLGNVLVGSRRIATLQRTTLDPASLRKQGDELFQGRPQRAAAGSVQQGYLEQSNVNSVREMVDLIATMRSFESSQKVTQALDETLGKAVNDVPKL
jgi:flagellar basal-body rod protein FlgG